MYVNPTRQIPNVFDMAQTLDMLSVKSKSMDTSSVGPAQLDSSLEINKFPEHLLLIVYSLLGNKMCVDCHSRKNLTWASVGYGTVMCEQCAFDHLSSGLTSKHSAPKSLDKTSWNLREVIALLEGGNAQFLRCIGADYKAFDEQNRRSSTGNNKPIKPKQTRRNSFISTISSSHASASNSGKPDEKDLDKYKKKHVKIYMKKLSDRVDEVVNTFATTSIESESNSNFLNEKDFKPIHVIHSPVREVEMKEEVHYSSIY